MLLDINQLKKTIKDGVTKGIWIYYPSEEGIGYGTVSPAPLVEISEDVTLYTPEEAQRVGIKIKGDTVVKVSFAGSWDRYKRIKTLTDELSKEATNANVKLVLRADFESGLEVGGDQFTMMRDVLESLGIGKIAVEAVPATQEASDG